MRIKHLKALSIAPLKNVEIYDLGDMVIIAGANGAGKSRLRKAITASFSDFYNPQISFTVESTRKKQEEDAWGARELKVEAGRPAPQAFTEYMQTRTRGGTYTGSLIQIDADRALQPVEFEAFNMSTEDPDERESSRLEYMNELKDRWPVVVNNIYKRIINRTIKISSEVNNDTQDKTTSQIKKRFKDPVQPFRDATRKLLVDKELVDLDIKAPRELEFKDKQGTHIAFRNLSSGEQEIIKVVFDFLDREISHSVVLIDEPELHLHPTLTFRLIETLRELGRGTNQFIFFSHSADLISTYYASGNVYFIDPTTEAGNQAHKLSELVDQHSNLVNVMGERLGLFAVGKKILFVEGGNSSIDRLTYHSIAQSVNPDLTIVPVGTVGGFDALNQLGNEIKQTIFGIHFYLIRDRDGLTLKQVADLKEKGIYCLGKRHIENYFLNEEVLAWVAEQFEVDDPILRNPNEIKKELKKIASSMVQEALYEYAKEYFVFQTHLITPRIDKVQSDTTDNLIAKFAAAAATEFAELPRRMTAEQIYKDLEEKKNELEKSLTTDKWKDVFPGKRIFQKFAGKYKLSDSYNRVSAAYVNIALAKKKEIFQDIIDLMADFK